MIRGRGRKWLRYYEKVEAYQNAVLVDKFGLRPWEIARLSDRLINEVYFHARDDKGALLVPSPPVNQAEIDRHHYVPASFEEELGIISKFQEALVGQVKSSAGKGAELTGNIPRAGITNWDQMVKDLRAKWDDGSRQKKRQEWERDQEEKARKKRVKRVGQRGS